MVFHTLRTYTLSHDWKSPFVVHGYTSAQLLVDGVQDRILYSMRIATYMEEKDTISVWSSLRRTMIQANTLVLPLSCLLLSFLLSLELWRQWWVADRS